MRLSFAYTFAKGVVCSVLTEERRSPVRAIDSSPSDVSMLPDGPDELRKDVSYIMYLRSLGSIDASPPKLCLIDASCVTPMPSSIPARPTFGPRWALAPSRQTSKSIPIPFRLRKPTPRRDAFHFEEVSPEDVKELQAAAAIQGRLPRGGQPFFSDDFSDEEGSDLDEEISKAFGMLQFPASQDKRPRRF